jgi:predicted PolB exonuclease-like 3'-5' exonuclease
VAAGRRLYDLGDLEDEATAKAMFHLRQMQAGTDFLRHHLHRIVAISVVLRAGDGIRVWSLGDEADGEAAIIKRFFDGLDRYCPTLVSWNGSGFDLPVLHYRALVHGICAARYWDAGADDSSFRFNNYLNRFHERHTDVMDVLSGYQPRAAVGLDEVATMLGLPGKQGMSGAEVWPAYQAGEIGRIRDYCETDVLNTYLVYLRFELIRGRLTPTQYERECALVRDTLERDDREHIKMFLGGWIPMPIDGQEAGKANDAMGEAT